MSSNLSNATSPPNHADNQSMEEITAEQVIAMVAENEQEIQNEIESEGEHEL